MITVKTKELFWRLTLKDILTILCSAAIPLALAVYGSRNYQQQRDQSQKAIEFDRNHTDEARQQSLYDKFLNNIYKLDKNGYLKPNNTPWAFANAYFKAAHRQWDERRKGDVLQFLKEKQLIGRSNCTRKCREEHDVEDIIRLNEISFDNVRLISETRLDNALLDLSCTSLKRVSWKNGEFSFLDFYGAVFDGSRLNDAKFSDSSLKCASFIGTQLDGVDFGNANLQDALFANVDLSTAKLTQKQYEQAVFYNVKFPPGLSSRIKFRTTQMPTTTVSSVTTPCTELKKQVTTEKAKVKVFKETLDVKSVCGENGQLVTFDDLVNEGAIPNGYQNMNWRNGWLIEKMAYGNQSGYYIGTASGNYSFYNRNGQPMILTSSTFGRLFSLKSCVAAAVWNDYLQLEIVGYRSEKVVANYTYILHVFTANQLKFDGYSKLDRVVWKTSGGRKNPLVNRNGEEFTMDNLCFVFN